VHYSYPEGPGRFFIIYSGALPCSGGVHTVALSLLLWCLVVDDLIARLKGGGVYTQELGRLHLSFGSGEIPRHGVGACAVGPSRRRDLVRRDRLIPTKLGS